MLSPSTVVNIVLEAISHHEGGTIHNTNKYTYNNLYRIIRNTQDASAYIAIIGIIQRIIFDTAPQLAMCHLHS